MIQTTFQTFRFLWLWWSTEIQIHVRQGIQTTFVFSFSKNIVYPNLTFFSLDFSLFPLSAFDNILKQRYCIGEPSLLFLIFSCLRQWFTIYNYHFTTITNTLFYKQLGSVTSPSSCLKGLSDFSALVIGILYTTG